MRACVWVFVSRAREREKRKRENAQRPAAEKKKPTEKKKRERERGRGTHAHLFLLLLFFFPKQETLFPANKQPQVEVPDIWLTNGNPWEVVREDVRYEVAFGGASAAAPGGGGRAVWTPSERVVAVAYDNPIPGYATTTTTNLRLWDARPVHEFDLTAFNAGDYTQAVAAKDSASAISAVLYPNDATPEGKELRLKQQYFFVSASLQDVLARFKAGAGIGGAGGAADKASWEGLPEKAVFQMNDTHPTIAVAELMRLLVDVEGLDWEQAWGITTRCVNYTNHTVMPEALEKWPVAVLAKMLPRHMEIIDIVNAGWQRFLEDKFSSLKPAERAARVARMSIVQENPWTKGEMLVNMAYLAVVAASAVNGVAAIHTEIVKHEIFDDFYALFPEKFQNKTNGVTPRRWLAWCNPGLAQLITGKLGSDKWVSDTYELRGLEKFADDAAFRAQWRAVKRANKAKLAVYLKDTFGDDVPLDALFDVQIKRIHEYKRQLMNVLSVIWRYKQLKKMTPEERKKQTPRVVMIGGKAASAYDMAKRIVHLVCKVGEKINHDPETKDLLRLYMVPDYNVSLAELIIPASELSQHISTAGTEASGTSNMVRGFDRRRRACFFFPCFFVCLARVRARSRMEGRRDARGWAGGGVPGRFTNNPLATTTHAPRQHQPAPRY